MKIDLLSTMNGNDFVSGNRAACQYLYDGFKALEADQCDVVVTLHSGDGCTPGSGKGDILHFHEYGQQSLEFARSSKFSKKIMTMHTSPALDYDDVYSPDTTRYTVPVLEGYDAIFVVNPREKAWLESVGIDTPTYHIGNAVNTDLFRPDPEKRKSVRSELKISDDTEVVLMVGHLQARKGITDFVQLAREVPNKTFILCGRDLYRESPVRRMMMSNALKSAPQNFVHVTHAADMSAMYNAADSYVCMSYAEGLPMTLLEASACGLPCICREQPFYRDMMPFVGGFFFTVSEAAWLLENTSLMRKTAAASRPLCCETASHTNIARKHLELYEKVLT